MSTELGNQNIGHQEKKEKVHVLMRIGRKLHTVCLEFAIVIGLVWILGATVINSFNIGNCQPWNFFFQIVSQFSLMTGFAFLGLGVLSAFKDSKKWHTYFEERLRTLVIERSYVQKLSLDELLKIQKMVYARIFTRKEEDINEQGGFFDYFNTSWARYMAEPSREKAVNVEEVQFVDDNIMLVKSTMQYVCRKGSTGIQENVRVCFNSEDGSRILAFKITLILPQKNTILGQDYCCTTPMPLCAKSGSDRSEFFCWTDTEYIEKYCAKFAKQSDKFIKLAEMKQWLTVDGTRLHKDDQKLKNELSEPGDYRFILDLKEKQNCDGLSVIIEMYQTLAMCELQEWSMPLPTRDITIILSYPDGYDCDVSELFFEHQSRLERKTIGTNSRQIIYPYWLLPGQGVTWMLTPKK